MTARRLEELPAAAVTWQLDSTFPQLFDAILADSGIQVVLSGVQMPRMNSIVERWIQTCRRELRRVDGDRCGHRKSIPRAAFGTLTANLIDTK